MTTGRAAGRRAGDHRDVEVAVEGQRQRARDRRGRHVERVRRAPADGRPPPHLVALHDAEAVLLVDDHHGRSAKATSPWIRACVPATMAASPEAMRARAPRRSAAVRRLVSSSQAHERAEQRPHGLEVLLGERLGGRHEGPLMALLDGAQQGVHGDHRLARADVALQQPAHGGGTLEVGVDLGDGVDLVGGQHEGQARQERRRRLAGRPRAPARCWRAARRLCGAAGRTA